MKAYTFRYIKDGSISSFSVIASSAIEAISSLRSAVGSVDIRYLRSYPARRAI